MRTLGGLENKDNIWQDQLVLSNKPFSRVACTSLSHKSYLFGLLYQVQFVYSSSKVFKLYHSGWELTGLDLSYFPQAEGREAVLTDSSLLRQPKTHHEMLLLKEKGPQGLAYMQLYVSCTAQTPMKI